MQTSLKIALLRLALVNLIPVIGVIFFEWELFEIGVSYVLETFAIYTVYEIDHFFIDKRTRLPFVFAFIQLVFALVTVAAFMFATILIIYFILTPPDPHDFTKDLFRKLDRINLIIPLSVLITIEFITYYIRKSKDVLHQENSTWRVIRRILYSHLYISGSLMFLFFFPQSLVLFIPFFIGLKIVLEYSTEDERVFKALGVWILKTRMGRWFTEYSKNEMHPKGYLSKKPTYSRRNRQK
jgi:hypothetical protein